MVKTGKNRFPMKIMLFQPQSQKGPFCWPEWPKTQLFGSKTLENDVWESFWDFWNFDL